MNKIQFFPGKLIILLIASLAAGNASATLCSMDGMQRSVNVVYSEPGQNLPCEVVYEKSSAAEDISTAPTLTLWRAEHQAGYCESRAEEFVAKLQQLGWQCQMSMDAMPVLHSDSDTSDSNLETDPAVDIDSGADSTDAVSPLPAPASEE